MRTCIRRRGGSDGSSSGAYWALSIAKKQLDVVAREGDGFGKSMAPSPLGTESREIASTIRVELGRAFVGLHGSQWQLDVRRKTYHVAGCIVSRVPTFEKRHTSQVERMKMTMWHSLDAPAGF